MKPTEVDTIITHGPNCFDGFLCYVITRKFFEENRTKDEELLCFKTYPGSKLPELSGRNVIITDISFPSNDIVEFAKHNKVFVMDHHETEIQDLENLDESMKHIDIKECGASLTWRYFYPEKEEPMFLKYIKAYDLWHEEIDKFQEFVAWIPTVDKTYESYIRYLDDDDMFIEEFAREGPIMLKKDMMEISDKLPRVNIIFQSVENKFLFIAYINSTNLVSLLGDRIMKEYPLIDFACVYIICESNPRPFTKFCLRSSNVNYPCSEIAKVLGGGGHRNASSCSSQNGYRLKGKTYDTNSLYKLLYSVEIKIITVNDKSYHIALLEAPYKKYELSKYLLQKKYEDNDFGPVQSACDIIRKRDRIDNFFKVDLAIVYSYDLYKMNTSYVINFDVNDFGEEIQIRDKLGIEPHVVSFDSPGMHTLIN